MFNKLFSSSLHRWCDLFFKKIHIISVFLIMYQNWRLAARWYIFYMYIALKALTCLDLSRVWFVVSSRVTVLNFCLLGHICRREVDLLAWLVGYFEFKLFCVVKVHSKLPHVWNARVKLLLWSSLLRFWVITGAAFQVFANRNTLLACWGVALWLFGPSVSQQMCVPREGRVDGFSCGLLCKCLCLDPAPQEGQPPILV